MKVMVKSKNSDAAFETIMYDGCIKLSVETYTDSDCGYDGSPMWVLVLKGTDTASFRCSDWTVDVEA